MKNTSFELDSMRYLTQFVDARKYLDTIDKDFFTNPVLTDLYSLVQAFHKKYRKQPKKGDLLKYLNKAVKASAKAGEPLTEDQIKRLQKGVFSVFSDIENHTDHVRDTLTETYQKKKLKELFLDHASNLSTYDKEDLDSVFHSIHRIKSVDSEGDEIEGEFLLTNHRTGASKKATPRPTYLKGVNAATSAGGFHTPQLIVFMSAPKSFKTGIMINIAMQYVLMGYKVYYADAENGDIRDRAAMNMLNCTEWELQNNIYEQEHNALIKWWSNMGGELAVDFYPPRSKTLADVENRLAWLEEEEGFKPDIIFYDYLDLFLPIDSSIKDHRFKLQGVYFDAIKLHKKLGIFGFTPSQVNRAGVDAAILDETNLSEDFGKAANAHGAFAINLTEVERAAQIARISSVFQRKGAGRASNHACFVAIDHARMQVKEITREEWERRFKEAEAELEKRRIISNNSKVKRNG